MGAWEQEIVHLEALFQYEPVHWEGSVRLSTTAGRTNKFLVKNGWNCSAHKAHERGWKKSSQVKGLN